MTDIVKRSASRALQSWARVRRAPVASRRRAVPGRARGNARGALRTLSCQPGSGSTTSPRGRTVATASCTSAKTPPATPPRSAAPNAEPSSATGALDRHAEHGGDRSAATVGAGAAARDPRARDVDAEPAQQVERVPQAEGDALEHRARRARRGRDGAAGRRRRRGRPGPRAACARPARYGRKSSPSAPGAQRSASATSASKETSGAIASRSHCSEPAAESITPIACHASGTAWQKTCTRPLGSGAVGGQRGEDDAGGAEHDRERARAGRPRRRAPRPRSRRRLPRPGRLPRRRCAPGDGGRLEHGREPVAGDLERVEHLVAPAPARRRRGAASPTRPPTSIAHSPVSRRRT